MSNIKNVKCKMSNMQNMSRNVKNMKCQTCEMSNVKCQTCKMSNVKNDKKKYLIGVTPGSFVFASWSVIVNNCFKQCPPQTPKAKLIRGVNRSGAEYPEACVCVMCFSCAAASDLGGGVKQGFKIF